jgi:hypothetical protein
MGYSAIFRFRLRAQQKQRAPRMRVRETMGIVIERMRVVEVLVEGWEVSVGLIAPAEVAGDVVGVVEVKDGGGEVAKVVLVDVGGGAVVGGGVVWVGVVLVWEVGEVGEVEVCLVSEVSLVEVVFVEVDFSVVESLLCVEVILRDVVCSDVAVVSFFVAADDLEDVASFFWRLTAISLSSSILCDSSILSAIIFENAVVRWSTARGCGGAGQGGRYRKSRWNREAIVNRG